MKLLHFAHRGEAQAFIQELSMEAHPELVNIYLCPDYYLFISGEGITETLAKLGHVAAVLKPSSIINLGIAGSLVAHIAPGEIFEIRTSYASIDGPVFHSYTTNASEALIDCISAFTRVLSDEKAQELAPFAPIVDRELWAVAKVAQQCKIPFYGIKLISDFAGGQTNCFDLAAKAQDFSYQLYHYFANLSAYSVNSPMPLKSKDDYTKDFPLHLTFTGRNTLNNLLQKIVKEQSYSIGQIKEMIQLTEILASSLRPKEQTAQVIERLKEIQNPVVSATKKKLNNLLAPLSEVGAQVHFDTNLEKESFKITMDINSQKNLENLQRALTHIDYQTFKKIINSEL